MEKYIFDQTNGLWYELQGDYYIPCLVLDEARTSPISMWARKHQQYLKEHRPVLYSDLVLSGKLHSYLADIDITDNSDMVYQLYARKSGSYFVNKVTRFQMDDLRPDLMERARAMTTSRTANHPWKSMSDEELLRSAGLILKDPERQLEGITLAAILLFGKDSTILAVLPQHKTDAIFRVENLDRYDDRDVIITNLLEPYDRLIAFGQKHLSDPFVQEGLQSVSARDRILREIFSNSLAHRDYSSGYVAKFVIERNRLYTENANRSHGHGALHLSSFEPYAKNPPISKVFREIGLADELGSGMRNTYKYTKLYSGGTPEFIEGDVFRTVVPLAPVAVEKVGPQDGNQVTTQVTTQVAILTFCKEPRSKTEIMEHCGYKNAKNFTQLHLRPLIESGQIQMTISDKPRSRNQKYVTVQEVTTKKLNEIRVPEIVCSGTLIFLCASTDDK